RLVVGRQPAWPRHAVDQDRLRLLHERHGPRRGAALPLRPAHAAGLEGVPAGVTGGRGPGGGLARLFPGGGVRIVAAMALLALGLSACETSSNIGGVADYDALSK